MKNLPFILKLSITLMLFFSISIKAYANSLDEGIELFNNDEFKKSKFLFEKNLVFNPKSEKSYLYLAKIFSKEEKEEEQERNLNSVLLLNPKNEEAIYMLTLLKIKQSNYEMAKELIQKFSIICISLCSKKNEINDKFKKLTPENAKNNN